MRKIVRAIVRCKHQGNSHHLSLANAGEAAVASCASAAAVATFTDSFAAAPMEPATCRSRLATTRTATGPIHGDPYGVIGDYGPTLTIYPNGTIDPELVRLDVASLHNKLEDVTGHWQTTLTCSFHASVTARTPLVAGSGTGSYRGISGSVDT